MNDVLELVRLLGQMSAGGDYIFRGEPECYEKVSSSLCRQYINIEDDGFDIEVVQREILLEARKYTSETDDLEILTQLQHYGGKTNLIDFTTDFLTALFFACDGYPDEDGRVILLRRAEETDNHFFRPRNPANRVIAQKSIFVRPPKGFVEPDDTVAIPHALKQPTLSYLRTSHGMSTETIYNDLQGFIRVQKIHESAYTKLYEGLTFQFKGQHQQAIRLYTESLRLNSSYAAAYNNRGVVYGTEGHLDLAIQDFTKALELNPQDADAYNNRGVLYSMKRNYDPAILDYSRALELNPNYAGAYNNRGNAYNDKHCYDHAIQDFNKALELNPNFAGAYNNRGTAYKDKGDLDRAIRDYDKALELQPNDASAYNNRGAAYRLKGEFERAINDCNKALELDPRSLAVYNNRGLCWLHLAEWERARSDLSIAKSLGEDLAKVLSGAGYESIANFEQKNDVQLPEDIAAMFS